MAWSKIFFLGLPLIASLVFRVLVKDEWRRMSPKFHLFVSDIN